MQPQQTVSKEYLQKIHQENEKRREENNKYVQLVQGEQIIKIDMTQIPIETQTKQGYPRYVWQTENTKNGNKLFLSTSPTLNGFIVEALLADINPFTLIKVGEGKNTRYSIKELGR